MKKRIWIIFYHFSCFLAIHNIIRQSSHFFCFFCYWTDCPKRSYDCQKNLPFNIILLLLSHFQYIDYSGKPRVVISHRNIVNMIGQLGAVFTKYSVNIDNMINKSKGNLAYNICCSKQIFIKSMFCFII